MFSVCISFLLLFSYPLIGLVLWDRRILIIIIIIIIFRFKVILEIEEKKMYCIAPLCIKDVHSSVSFNSANITTPSSYEDKTETV
jgi:hypothetical protein